MAAGLSIHHELAGRSHLEPQPEGFGCKELQENSLKKWLGHSHKWVTFISFCFRLGYLYSQERCSGDRFGVGAVLSGRLGLSDLPCPPTPRSVEGHMDSLGSVLKSEDGSIV